MGYATYYTLEVLDVDHKGYDAMQIAKYIQEKQEEDEFYAFASEISDFIESGSHDEEFVFDCDEECKWDDHESEMIELSKTFPDIVFKLHGEGEENGDLWDQYFMNGRMQYCPAEIVYPPFDKTQLSEPIEEMDLDY